MKSFRSNQNQYEILRVLDAAANRAREGLRVVEDFVRFTLNDSHLTNLLKTFRHDLVEILIKLDEKSLLDSRNTTCDVGTEISTATEQTRVSITHVVKANLKRVEEAIRTLEEFGKIISPLIGEQLGELRYKFYSIEKAILLTQEQQQILDDHNLYLLVTEKLCLQGAEAVIRGALDAGIRIIQVREKSMADRDLIKYGKRVREWTRSANALFIMNDRPDLAVLTDADGVHVGQEELSVSQARQIVGPDMLVGLSTHTIEQAREAVLTGASYIGVGPVFSSKTKQFDELAGLDFVNQVASEITLPWFAIGGINATNIEQVSHAGATRIAISNAICNTENPENAAHQLLSRLQP